MRILIIASIWMIIGSCKGNEPLASPPGPENLTASVNAGNQVLLTWTDNSTDVIAYYVEVKSGSGAYQEVAVLNKNTLNFTDIGLAPNTTYTYRLYSILPQGALNTNSKYSNESTITTGAANSGIPIETITIGTQVWMKKNLNVTRYRNGDPIIHAISPFNLTSLNEGIWNSYNNDMSNGVTYGHLYNAIAVKDPRNIAPIGWHVPTQAEFEKLILFLGGVDQAGGLLKSVGVTTIGTGLWNPPNTGSQLRSGFAALPAGYSDRSSSDKLGIEANFWTSSPSPSGTPSLYLNTNTPLALITSGLDRLGFSVRCIKD